MTTNTHIRKAWNIQDVKRELPILEAVRRYVPGLTLHRRSSKYWGCCPLHNEKTPSFMIDSVKDKFCCFGCGEYGDGVDLISKVMGLSLGDTFKMLADDLGIITQVDDAEQRERQRKWQAEREQREAIERYEQKLINTHKRLKALYILCREKLQQLTPESLDEPETANIIILTGNLEIIIDVLLGNDLLLQTWALKQAEWLVID